MKLVLATRNRDKVREIRDMLSGLDVELTTIEQYPDTPPTVEDGATLEENALKKARDVRAATGLSALADDTGLEVDSLGGAPGVRAARYAGESASYSDNCRKVLAELEGVPAARRTARFHCVMALCLAPADAARLEAVPADKNDRHEDRGPVDCLVAEGLLYGEIGENPRGSDGFGYDPVFIEPSTGKTLAEMTPAEKNRRSHRYRALLEMREMLLRYGLAGER